MSSPCRISILEKKLRSHRQGDAIRQVPVSLVVDFNGDGIVDCADMSLIVDHWHTDNSETNKTLGTPDELAT